MISLQILCIGIAAIALSFGESEAKTYHYTVPASKLSSTEGQHIHKYTIPSAGNAHTYRYKLPGVNHTHSYRYKLPGTNNVHTYRYKEPGQVNTHHYRIPGQGAPGNGSPGNGSPGNGSPVNGAPPANGAPGNDMNPNQVTGVYSLINTIYNYFAVGGQLTGVPPLDLLLLKYYVAQGPKSFCPNGGK